MSQRKFTPYLNIEKLIKLIFALEKISFVRFVLTGMINTVATYFLYLALLFLGLHYRLSYFCAFLLAVTITTAMNYGYTFNNKLKIGKVLIYITYYCMYFSCCILIVDVLIVHFNVSETIAPIITIIVTVYPNYLLSKKLILGNQ